MGKFMSGVHKTRHLTLIHKYTTGLVFLFFLGRLVTGWQGHSKTLE